MSEVNAMVRETRTNAAVIVEARPWFLSHEPQKPTNKKQPKYALKAMVRVSRTTKADKQETAEVCAAQHYCWDTAQQSPINGGTPVT